MNWDWEKLREKKEKYEKNQGSGSGGGMPKPPKPPQFDELFNKLKGFKFPWILLVIIVLAALFFGSSVFFQVQLDEVGVVQRFGQFNRLAQPGLNFKLPAGIEKVTKVKIKRIYKEEFGFRTVEGSDQIRYTSENTNDKVALMLTGDLNVAVVPWIVQYRISDPYKYLFKVRDVKSLLRDMSEAIMSMIVGDRSINEVISGREEIAVSAKKSLQKEMDEADSGLTIVTVEMKKTNVPEPVQPSFNEVNEAIQEKEQTIYKAREEYNKAVPRARGEAKRVIQDAEGYAVDRVNRAQGDAAKFTEVYREYAKAEDVTRKRLYLESMADILPKLGKKYIIDSDQKNLLPLLNMQEGKLLESSK